MTVFLGMNPTEINYAHEDVLQIIATAKSSNTLTVAQKIGIITLSVDARVSSLI